MFFLYYAVNSLKLIINKKIQISVVDQKRVESESRPSPDYLEKMVLDSVST